MAAKQQTSKVPGGRQSAYVQRNRAALIKAALEVLAEIGPGATFEQLASHAQVSPTTIYKYFESKDALFGEALNQIWSDWVQSASGGAGAEQSFDAVLDVLQRLLWVEKTDPFFASVLRNTLATSSFLVESVIQGARPVYLAMAKKGEISAENFDIRIEMLGYSAVAIMNSVLVKKTLSPKEAEPALGIALLLLGLSEAKIKKFLARATFQDAQQ